MKMPTCHKNENGVALVISLVFIALLGMLGTTAYVMTSTDLKIGSNYRAGAEAFFDADAGIHYGAAMIEAGLKAGSFTMPLDIGNPTDPSDANSTSMASVTAPTGFNFSFQAPGLTKIADMTYQFTCIGASTNNSTVTITATLKRQSAIAFGAFGDVKLDLGNTAAVYSYSHTDDPGAAGPYTGEGDVGSNESVILRNTSIVDGDVALGEDPGGTGGTLTDQGGVVTGTNGEDIDRVDPDPLGVVGGEYAADFATYGSSNDNSNVFSNSGNIIDASNDIDLGNQDDLTLKGPGNYYVNDISVGNKAALYIDTTNGPVHIYLTGELDAVTGSEVVNTTGCGAGACSCCIWTPNLDCSACAIGAPSDFAIFANSQSSTDKVSIGNSVAFSGLIYAPYITVRIDNGADIYGAIVGREVEITAASTIYYDTDLADQYASKNLELITWRDVRN